MLIRVSTRKLRRLCGRLRAICGQSPGAAPRNRRRRFVALSAERLAAWMASDLSKLDRLIIQIDSLRIGNDPKVCRLHATA